MKAPRTKAIVDDLEANKATRFQAITNLRFLNDWSTKEVKRAVTNDYRARWEAERDASAEVLGFIT